MTGKHILYVMYLYFYTLVIYITLNWKEENRELRCLKVCQSQYFSTFNLFSNSKINKLK